MYGRQGSSTNIFTRNYNNSNNDRNQNISGGNNSYGNNYGSNYGNSGNSSNSYGSSYNNSYGNSNHYGNNSYGVNRDNYGSNNYGGYQSNNNQGVGTLRVNNYKKDEVSSHLCSMASQWKEVIPSSISCREQTLHLTTVQIRLEDYYSIRMNKLDGKFSRMLDESIRRGSFNEMMVKGNQPNLPTMPFMSQKPIQKTSYGMYSGPSNTGPNNTGPSNTGQNSSMNIFTRGNSNTGNSNTYGNHNSYNNNNNNSANIFTRSNSGNTSENIFKQNSNPYNTNNSNNIGSSYNTRGSSSNIFNQNNNNSNSNSYSRNNSNTSNIFNNNNNSSQGNNIFQNNGTNTSQNNQSNNLNNNTGNNIFNRNNVVSGNSNNIFSNSVSNSNKQIFGNNTNNLFSRTNVGNNNLMNNGTNNGMQNINLNNQFGQLIYQNNLMLNRLLSASNPSLKQPQDKITSLWKIEPFDQAEFYYHPKKHNNILQIKTYRHIDPTQRQPYHYDTPSRSSSQRLANEAVYISYSFILRFKEEPDAHIPIKGELTCKSALQLLLNMNPIKKKLQEQHPELHDIEINCREPKTGRDSQCYLIEGDLCARKINLPTGYSHTPQAFSGWVVSELSIFNEHGKVTWQQPINIKGIDFSQNIVLKRAFFECQIQQLERSCRVQFKQLPDKKGKPYRKGTSGQEIESDLRKRIEKINKSGKKCQFGHYDHVSGSWSFHIFKFSSDI